MLELEPIAWVQAYVQFYWVQSLREGVFDWRCDAPDGGAIGAFVTTTRFLGTRSHHRLHPIVSCEDKHCRRGYFTERTLAWAGAFPFVQYSLTLA